jgi:UDP-N-acetylmuramoyl-tripeptide--D-alanyl-D-alanine ligase
LGKSLSLSLFHPLVNMAVSGVHFDSRLIQPGQLFVALKGQRVDGHQFLKEVSEKGATAALVEKGYEGPSFGMQLIHVDSPLKSLQKGAQALISQIKGPVVGITGSVGKTTTRAFLQALMEGSFSVLATKESFNSQAGLPVSVINSYQNQEMAVLEMGINEPGEMEQLTQIVQPSVGVLTRIAPVHIEKLKSLEGIAKEKCALFKSARMEKAIIHHSCLQYKAVQELNLSKVSYSLENKDANYFFDKETSTFYEEGKQVAKQPYKESHIAIAENMLAAFAAARQLGIEAAKLVHRFKQAKFEDHRFKKVQAHGITFIDDSYNANPFAVKTAFDELMKMEGERKIAVLGAMGELGGLERSGHEEIASLALKHMDACFFTGQPWKNVERIEPKMLFQDKQELVKSLEKVLKPGDIVLVKGSKSYKMWEVIQSYIARQVAAV